MERKKIGVIQAFSKAIPHFIQVSGILVLIYSILDSFDINGDAEFISGGFRMSNFEEGMILAIIIYIIGKTLEIKTTNFTDEK